MDGTRCLLLGKKSLDTGQAVEDPSSNAKVRDGEVSRFPMGALKLQAERLYLVSVAMKKSPLVAKWRSPLVTR